MSTDQASTSTGPAASGASVGDVTSATDARGRARAAVDDADDEWRYAIGSAIDGGRSAAEVAEAAGITLERAQQIHDGGA